MRLSKATIESFRAYRGRHPGWGSLHVVLDDMNLEDFAVDQCIELARDNDDIEGLELSIMLYCMSEYQRRKMALGGYF